MAYDSKKLEEQALKAVETYNLFFINDIMGYLPCSRSTFYDLGLDQSDTIKDALEVNRIKTKSSMRSKWYKSDNATLQVALMKLIAEDDERKKLSQTYSDVTSGGDKLKTLRVEFIDEATDEDEEEDGDSEGV
jgi:hypothetical protein